MKITVFPQTPWWCPSKALWQKVSPVYGLHPLGTEIQEKKLYIRARNLWQEQMRRQKQEYKVSARTGDKTIASKLPLLSLFFQQFSTKNRLSVVSSKEMFSVSKPFSMSSINQQFDSHCNSRNLPLHWHSCVDYMSWWNTAGLQIQSQSHWPFHCAISVLAHIKDFGRSLFFWNNPWNLMMFHQPQGSWEWHSPSLWLVRWLILLLWSFSVENCVEHNIPSL